MQNSPGSKITYKPNFFQFMCHTYFFVNLLFVRTFMHLYSYIFSIYGRITVTKNYFSHQNDLYACHFYACCQHKYFKLKIILYNFSQVIRKILSLIIFNHLYFILQYS